MQHCFAAPSLVLQHSQKLTWNWRSRTFAICLIIRCFPATFRRVICQTLCSSGLFRTQGRSWRTAKQCSWGCSENEQLLYVSHSTLGLLCHPVTKIMYTIAISIVKSNNGRTTNLLSPQCFMHTISISAVISALFFSVWSIGHVFYSYRPIHTVSLDVHVVYSCISTHSLHRSKSTYMPQSSKCIGLVHIISQISLFHN